MEELDPQDVRTWMARLEGIAVARDLPLDTMDTVPGGNDIMTEGLNGRPRRGLMDFVGRVSRTLFGTAMNSDVKMLQRVVDDTRGQMRSLYHDSKAMISVLNQTRRYVSENRQDINGIQREMQYLLHSVNAYAGRLANLTERVQILELSRQIDGLISELEIVVNDYRTQKAIFHRQKLQLERGWLTEDILPPPYLHDVLDQIIDKGHEVVRDEWYYQHITVRPMWETISELTYQVMFPALSRESYLHFALYYVGIPWGEGFVRKVKGPNEVALNTGGSTSFEPNDKQCMGTRPRVCRPVEEHVGSNCAVDLISQRDRPACLFEVTPRNNKSVEMFRLAVDIDEIILSSYEKIEITFRCASDAPRYRSVLGPTKLTIPNGCSLETPEWVVSGIDRGSSSAHLPAAMYREVPRLNLSWPQAPHAVVLRQLEIKQRAEVSAVDVRGWVDVDLEDVAWSPDVDTLIYVGVGVVAGSLLVGLITFGGCVLRKRLRGDTHGAQRSRGPPAAVKGQYGEVSARDELEMVVLKSEGSLPDQYPEPVSAWAALQSV